MYWQRIGWRKKGRMKFWLKSSNTPSAQRDRHKCVTKFCRNTAEPRAGQGTQGFNREKGLSRGKSLSYKMMISLTLLPHQTKQVQVHLSLTSFSVIAVLKRGSTLPVTLLVSSCFSFFPFQRMELWQLYYVLECQALELWCPSSQQAS